MQQVKLTLSDDQVQFLGHHRAHGFRDRSELVRMALERFRRDLDRLELEESARLYNETYDQDPEANVWVEDAVKDWPE